MIIKNHKNKCRIFFVNEEHSNEVSSIKFTLLGLLIGALIVIFEFYVAALVATVQELEFAATTLTKFS